MPRPGRAHTGFTLVELLVVIGIIGLLISILLPTLNAARQAARTTICLSNLRSLNSAFAMYLNENRQTYPQSAQNGKITVNGSATSTAAERVQGSCVWFNALDAFLNRNLKAYSSDSAKDRDRNYTPLKEDPIWPSFGENADTPAEQRQRTFKMNSYFGNTAPSSGVGVLRWAKSRSVPRSAETVLLFDGIAKDAAIALPDTSSPALDFSGKWNSVALRHGRGKSADVLFADGHAAEVSQSIRLYVSSGVSTYNTWQPEYIGESVQDDPAATAKRNPDQQLIWDFWRP